MKHGMRSLLLVFLLLGWLGAAPASAQTAIEIQDIDTLVEFPDRITFNAHAASEAQISRVVLEYGVEKLTCGTVVAKAFPAFTPAPAVDLTWTWEMRQSGSQPPGTRIWYRWRVSDAAGHERVSEKQRLTWLDKQHDWESISSQKLTLHWYEGSPTFAKTLLDSAAGSLQKLAKTTGVALDAPTDLYIYASTEDMRAAVLYEPGWTGGLAFADHDIVIIGISPDQLDWGKRTEAHELTHVLVGHRTFSCLGALPTWLNEGVAVYGEGGPDKLSLERLSDAVGKNELISLRALSGGFAEDPAKADLSYAQSYSVVKFLIDSYGQARLTKLFDNLRDGMRLEDGLQAAYGFGLDELEQRWRKAVGAPALLAGDAQPTATAPATMVPTYPPLAAVPLSSAGAPTPAPLAEATAAPGAGPSSLANQPAAERAPGRAWPTWTLVLLPLGVVVLFGVLLALVYRAFVGRSGL